jgi:hypothetical protein
VVALMAWLTLPASAVAWALVGVAWDPQTMPVTMPVDQAAAVPALVELTERTSRRCPNCGTIESKRALPRLASELLSYEYRVRMGDGSSHLFREQMPVSWRLGERLILIEGAVSPD